MNEDDVKEEYIFDFILNFLVSLSVDPILIVQ